MKDTLQKALCFIALRKFFAVVKVLSQVMRGLDVEEVTLILADKHEFHFLLK